ncbi:ring-cleavage extradiol dioxygenase [Bradyrhizobium sp. SSBR45G]|uniref:VOC family protein n=1 Tax=unclassified Bradyrhizobium TaxID=2631580 RepID=UPI002342B0C0|nr:MULTISPECIES: VOC family protein [unclassified Bradyrhizobium]GLH75181.1 ring-cleavage extradiol dioxygenase [Bradyrhizobium sp. SSBR45G]GLH83032.1 ring-cleavage extradiol dioxygenase [Bradyrhizobium sp. SSBR45R]
MTADLTRRALLKLAGATSMTMAAVAAARAEGGGESTAAGPTFASRTPIRIGMMTLRVNDADKVAAFYRDVIGLSVLQRTETMVRLGAGGVPLVELEARPGAGRESPRSAGLFHTAFLMPTRKDLARWLVHVALNRTPLTGFADHNVSEAVYLDDPEGNGVEVYADRAPELWQWRDGSVRMGTDQLDVDDLVALTDTRTSSYAGAPDGLRIGHVHLKVGDIGQASGFYTGLIGLNPTRTIDRAAFLSSGRYHHHIGANTWRSAGAGRRDDGSTGLSWFSFEVGSTDLLAGQEARLRGAGASVTTIANGLETADPWGTKVRLIKV